MGKTMTKKMTALAILIAAVTAGCVTVRRSGGSLDTTDLNRAELARCVHAEIVASFTPEAIAALAGSYDLYLFDEDGGEASGGHLELQAVRNEIADPDPLAGPAPALIGATDIDAEPVGAVIPGDAASTAPGAPGVGLYRFGPEDARIRLGSEANRRDRTRFDGAHTTLTLTAIGDGRFGGSWASAEGARASSGDFCAERTDR